MKIGWIIPVGADSAIGLYSRTVVRELARRGASMVLLRPPTGTGLPRNLRSLLLMLRARSLRQDLIDELDLCVVNCGTPLDPLAYRKLLPQARVFAIFHAMKLDGGARP